MPKRRFILTIDSTSPAIRSAKDLEQAAANLKAVLQDSGEVKSARVEPFIGLTAHEVAVRAGNATVARFTNPKTAASEIERMKLIASRPRPNRRHKERCYCGANTAKRAKAHSYRCCRDAGKYPAETPTCL